LQKGQVFCACGQMLATKGYYVENGLTYTVKDDMCANRLAKLHRIAALDIVVRPLAELVQH
jgi:hypothetical protein